MRGAQPEGQTTFALSAGWSIRPSNSCRIASMRSPATAVTSERRKRPLRTGAAGFAVLLVLGLCGGARAEGMAKPTPQAAPQSVPGFWDPRRRPDRPDLSRLTVIRFLTETDYPPFNFTGPAGN